jgi:hypothetical protein
VSKKARRILMAVAVAFLLVAPCLGVYAGVHLPAERRARRLSAQLDRDVASYEAYWSERERPVLRGDPIPGDAAEAAREAVATLPAIDLPDDLRERLAAGDPPDDVVALTRTHAAELHALRESARRPRSFYRIDFARAGDAPMSDFMPVVRGVRLLAVQAAVAEPGECLRIGADAIRIAQDFAPGASVLGTSVAAVLIETVAPVMERCLDAATGDERAAAARELDLLVEHAPPIGCALEAEALFAAASFRSTGSDTPFVPTNGDELELIWTRREVLEAWEHVADDPAQWRALTEYPDAKRLWDAEEAARAATGNVLLGFAAGSLSRYVGKDMQVNERLEALAERAGAPAR